MSAIIVENLSKIYKKEIKRSGLGESIRALFKRDFKEILALNNVNFRIVRGEMVAIVGPNGAGKTTLLKILSGILYPTNGIVSVLGFTPYKKDPKYLRKITFHNGGQTGFIAEATWDIPAIDAYEFLKDIYKVPDTIYKKNLEFFVDLLDMKALIETPIRKLSTGERQKVEIIGALLHSPEIIFLDEPTIGLDIIAQKRLRETLRLFVKEQNLTLVITSHYMRDIEELGDRIILLNRGKVLFNGSKEGIVKEFFDYRRLSMSFAFVPSIDFSVYGNVTEITENRVKMLVRREKSKDIAAYFMKNFEVVDITFEEAPLEDVIRDIYKEV